MTSDRGAAGVLGLEGLAFGEHNCFGCGTLNEHGLGMVIHVEAGLAWSELELEPRFEGWDGIAHGGILATLLDEVMGWCLAASDEWAVTARLAVDFRKPVRVGQRLRVEGRVGATRRRVIETTGRIVDLASGVEHAVAEATFVTVDDARKQELQERYGVRRSATPEAVV